MAKLALCIGINDYPGTQNDLAGCVNDARDWAAALKGRGFGVRGLTNKQATGQAMREAMLALVEKAKAGDLVVIQYSGHGSFVPDEDGDEPDGTDECLCPYDVRAKGPITDDELFELYRVADRDVRVLMIADSCHSGTVARFSSIPTPPPIQGRRHSQAKVRFLPPASFLSRQGAARLGPRRIRRPASPPGRYGSLLMAGCQDTEYSYDAMFQGKANGAFSFVALRCLAALPTKATYRDWFSAIRRVLPSQQYPQTPNLYGSTSMKKWRVLE